MTALNHTVEEALALMKIGRSQFYKEISSGRLRIVKCGRRTLITESALRQWQAVLEAEATKVREAA